MKTYVLVASASLDISSEIMFPLIGKRYRNLPAMREAVEQMLGPFEENGWEFYPAEYFCEKWNDSTVLDNVFSSDESYIAFLEVEHAE